MQTKEQAFEKLARSKFRMRFHLGEKDLQYIDEKGMDVIRSHAEDFVATKLGPAFPKNDDQQRRIVDFLMVWIEKERNQ